MSAFAFASQTLSIRAQDPFGAAADPFGLGAPAAGGAMDAGAPAIGNNSNAPQVDSGTGTVVTEDPDPLVRVLRLSPPQTAEQYASAIEAMVGLGRWDEVGRYLDQLSKANWSKDQLDELSQTGGTSLWFKLRGTTTELNDAQRNFVRQLAALPAELARDANWIDSWINRLAAPSLAERREAQAKLRRSRRVGIERLCAHLLQGHPNVPGHALAEALLVFDAEGVEALRAACSVSDGMARARALVALAQTPSTEFALELSTGLESEVLPAQGRESLTKALLQRYSKLPEGASVYDFVTSRFKRQLDEYQLTRVRPSLAPVRVWRTGADGKSVVSVEASAADHALEALNQVALHRVAFVRRTPQDLVDSSVVLLQHAYQTQPGLESNGIAWQRMGIPEAEAKSSDFWKQVLDRSAEWQMHGASLRAGQMMASQLDKLAAGSPVFDFLAACMRDSRPAMRYMAVDAIAKANIQVPYNGASYALENAIEMSRLGQGPMVLIVGLSSDLRLTAEQQVLALGSQAVTAISTKEALQILDSPYPIERILIVDRLPTNSILTTVDRLRNSRRGGSLPIAVLTEDIEASHRRELERLPGVLLSVLSRAPDHMPRIFAEMERQLDIRSLTAGERASLAASAASLLTTISSDREKYGFYPLARWESELAIVTGSMSAEARMTVLGGMGTVSSQEQLAAVAGDQAAGADARTAAAAAFARSVARFGLLLTPRSVAKAYDLYNSQGPTDAVTVSALGQVLDAIETKTGKGE